MPRSLAIGLSGRAVRSLSETLPLQCEGFEPIPDRVVGRALGVTAAFGFACSILFLAV